MIKIQNVQNQNINVLQKWRHWYERSLQQTLNILSSKKNIFGESPGRFGGSSGIEFLVTLATVRFST